ncbi:MAG: sigma 54-interacting transcriptional regulator [Verrucomicrobiota bacterium]
MTQEEKRILFLCDDGATKASMAGHFAAKRKIAGVEVACAGIDSAKVHPVACEVMSEAGHELSECRPQVLEEISHQSFDIVITLGQRATEQCPVLPGNPGKVAWNIGGKDTNTGSKAGKSEFREIRDKISRLVNDFFDHGYFSALLEARKCSNLILDNISDGIIAHDEQRRIFFFNQAAENITGLNRRQVLGRDCHEAFDGGFCGGRCVYCDEPVPSPDGQNIDAEVSVKNGERKRVNMHYREMTDYQGNKVGMLVSFKDITRESRLAQKVGEVEQFAGIVGRDEKMLEIFDLIRELADTEAPVFIQGESGTGKELVAAAIHNEGPRANRQFVPVNCGALPESLLESELFGHVKGAFTGAIRDKKGRFELADKGTIFLDEIGDISAAMQIKLLRVLQEGHFERVGSEKTMEVDVRVISATNKDIHQEIREGRFREDLFYRLNVVPVHLPPLRERPNDIPLLVENAFKRFAKPYQKNVQITPEALAVMMSYNWPGNVRELHNWIQFALVKSRGKDIRPEHLPSDRMKKETEGRKASPRKRRLKVGSVREALRQTDGNKVEAAKLLGVSRATLYRFLDEAGGL